MNGMLYLTAALAFVWAGVALYVLRLALLRRELERRVALLEGQSRVSEPMP